LRTTSGDCVRTGSWSATSDECDAKPQAVSSAPQAVSLMPQPTKHTAATKVFFAFDRAEIDDDARKELDALAEKLRENGIDQVIAVGHADPVGTEAYNQRLSERRAEAVRDYLLAKGWPVKVFTVEGQGEQGTNPERRVDIDVVAVERPLAKTAKADAPGGE
jgi:OOP family OmpA-OmpF porin